MQLSLVGRNQRGDVSPCVIYTLFHVEKRIFIRVSLSLSLSFLFFLLSNVSFVLFDQVSYRAKVRI